MEKLRDKLGGWILFFLIIIFEVILVYIFPEHPTIITFISIAIALAIFYVINKLADQKELERITTKQNAFKKEFDNFKSQYAIYFESMPYLYPLIDMAQSQVIKSCSEQPNKYKEGTNFKKATVQAIISKLNEHLSTFRYSRDLHENEINYFINEIKRRERL